MTKAYLDSAYPPNAAQVAAARAGGFSGWNGYFAGPAILNGWGKADFDRVKAGGLGTMAYCSGWASPSAMRAQSASWAVPICLDVEGGIRSLIAPDDREYLEYAAPLDPVMQAIARPHSRMDELEISSAWLKASAWVQAWLDAAGAGQYGNYWVHPGVRAPFYVLAAYPSGGDPTNTSWWGGSPRPGPLCGWQWAGSHNFAGITVDSNWFDDALDALLRGSAPQPPQEDDMLFAGPLHPLSARLTSYIAGSWYREPIAAAEVRGGDIGKGAVYGVVGYRWTSSAVQAAIPAGADHVWWAVDTGGWVPDAYLDTSHLAGAPGYDPPGGELAVYVPAGGGGGVTPAQVDQAIATALGELVIVRKT